MNTAALTMKTLLPCCILIVCAPFFFACTPEEEPSPAPPPVDTETLLNKNWDLYDAHLETNPDSALFYMYKIKTIAKANEKKDWLANSYYQIAYVQIKQGYMGDAAYHFLRAAQMFKESGELSRLANAYTSVGDIYAKAEDFETAITYFKQAKDIFLYEGTSADKAKIYRNLAICHKELGDLAAANQLLSSAKEHAMEGKDYAKLSQVYNTWGTVNFDEKEFEKARDHYLLAFQAADSLPDELRIKASAYNNIGETYLKEGNYPLTEEWLNKALEIKKEIGDPFFTQSTLNTLAEFHIAQEQHDAAIEVLEQGLKSLPREAVNPALEEGLSLMMEALVKTNDKGTPAQYARLNRQLATYSQRLMAYNNQLSDLKQKLERTSTQQSLQLAVEKHSLGNQLQAAEEKNKQIQYAFIIPVLLLIGAAISIYLAIRRHRHTKKVINAIDDVLNKRPNPLVQQLGKRNE